MELYFVAAAVLICLFVIMLLVNRTNRFDKELSLLKTKIDNASETNDGVIAILDKFENMIKENDGATHESIENLFEEMRMLKIDILDCNDRLAALKDSPTPVQVLEKNEEPECCVVQVAESVPEKAPKATKKKSSKKVKKVTTEETEN